jgi:hypothetical protein
MEKTFDEAIKEQIDLLERTMEQYIVELVDDTVDYTAFKTGKLKNNTNVSFNIEDMRVSRSPDTTGAGAKSSARSVSKDYKLGDDIILNNGVEYAVYVELGTDKSSPNAFMGRAAEQFESQIQRAINKVK